MYPEILLHHYREPRGLGIPAGADRTVEVLNRSCGDTITLGWVVRDGRIEAIGYELKGCVMHRASASILCATLTGAEVAAVPDWVARVRALTEAGEGLPEPLPTADWAALADIRAYPTRRKCVLLAWEALEQLAAGG